MSRSISQFPKTDVNIRFTTNIKML